MGIYQIRSDVYDYLYCQGRSTLDEIIEAIDADSNSVYGACKHLKWDDYLGADTGNNEWWISDKGVAGLCPKCNTETEYGEGVELTCPDCGWDEPWTCSSCGDEEHDVMKFSGDTIKSVDVTCESVYLNFIDNWGYPSMVFSHDEFAEIINHFNESEYTTKELSR